jgi:hypothetical protein
MGGFWQVYKRLSKTYATHATYATEIYSLDGLCRYTTDSLLILIDRPPMRTESSLPDSQNL